MYELSIKGHFDAAHFLREYQGKCANIHGHTWEVEVIVSGSVLDKLGMLIDFSVLKKYLNEILDDFDHQLINNLPAFGTEQLNPTAENLAAYIYHRYQARLASSTTNTKLEAIRVSESPNATACFKERS